MKRPNIYEQYKAQYFDPSWLPYLMNHYTTFNLPTEFVAHEPGFFAPKQGRIYTTDLMVTQQKLTERIQSVCCHPCRNSRSCN